jgi:MerR family transcriptional regulator, thiopeptide resistance regulator
MGWSISQVVRMSGVTSRTLRHYDEIGLLRPASVAANGYRHYEREQLLRLQQILVLRDLGLGLDAIAKIVNDGEDPAERLRRHHRWLLEERDRFDRLSRAVEKTITELEGGEKVSEKSMFEAFDPDKQARYEAELVEQHGEGARRHIAESKRRMSGWTAEDKDRIQREWKSFGPRLVELIDTGAGVDDPRVQQVIRDHYGWVTNFWTPDRDSYPGLGETYAGHPDFRAQFDAQHARLADFLRDAMAAYARANL